MKLTRYEYKHNPYGDRKINRLSNYFPPLLRVMFICVMYMTLLYILLDIFIFSKFDLFVEIINCSIILFVSIFVFEHNPLFVVAFLIRVLYYVLSKQSIHKQMVFNLLKDYRNIIDFEKKLYISNVKISFLNPKKIIFSKNNKRGYISLKCVKLDKKVVVNDCSKYIKVTDYIHDLKSIIAELYKKNN